VGRVILTILENSSKFQKTEIRKQLKKEAQNQIDNHYSEKIQVLESITAEKYQVALVHEPKETDKAVLRIINTHGGGRIYSSLDEVFNEQLENPDVDDVFKVAIVNYRSHVMKDLQ
jgi:predicted transcriptional regulator YheO